MITILLCFIAGYIGIQLLFAWLYVTYDNWKTRKEFTAYLRSIGEL